MYINSTNTNYYINEVYYVIVYNQLHHLRLITQYREVRNRSVDYNTIYIYIAIFDLNFYITCCTLLFF